jgi:hypothetical protein
MSKMRFVALFVSLLALSIVPASIAPARSAEVATPDDTARFLAGLPPSPESPLAALTKDPTWQQHARYFDAIFGQVDRNHLSKIRAFSKERLTDTHDTMLYMFSGPDALHAIALFPKASTYVLSGLEQTGDIPQLTSLPRNTMARTLRSLESSMNSLLTISFFITKNMGSQLYQGPVYGTLPVISVFLARSGKTIRETSFVNIDNDGNLKPAAGEPRLKTVARGVKIVFTSGDGPEQTLYYFNTNLANDGVKSSGFLTFCANLGVADSFVKSASYLLHGGSFSTVRNFMLDHSGTILQDDTGIPVSYFDPKKWQLQPFGRYVGPIRVFSRNYQSQMAELFRKGRPIPLDFGLGYRWRTNETSLLLAEKIGAPKPEAKPVPLAAPKPEPNPAPLASSKPESNPAPSVTPEAAAPMAAPMAAPAIAPEASSKPN